MILKCNPNRKLQQNDSWNYNMEWQWTKLKLLHGAKVNKTELPPTHMFTMFFQGKTDSYKKCPLRSSDIVSFVIGAWSHWVVGWIGYTTLRRVPRLIFWWATAAQDGASDQQHRRSSPAQIQRCPYFHLLSFWYQWAVELKNNSMRWPAHRNKLQDWSSYECCSRADHHTGFGRFLLNAIGALGSHNSDKESKDTENDGHHHQSASRL